SGFDYFQRSLNCRLRGGAACSALGRGDRWYVSFPFMDLFFVACDFFADRSGARSQSPFDGCGRSDGHQTIAHYDFADRRWDIDRPVRDHQRRAHRPHHFNLSRHGDNFRATAIARGTEWRGATGPSWTDLRRAGGRALEFLAKSARIQFADAPPTFE